MINEQTDSQEQTLAGRSACTSTQSSTPENGVNADLHGECERLRQRVKSLEEERLQAQQSLAVIKKERDEYLRALYAVARAQFTEEELRNVPDRKDCAPLDQFVEKLDRIVHQS